MTYQENFTLLTEHMAQVSQQCPMLAIFINSRCFGEPLLAVNKKNGGYVD